MPLLRLRGSALSGRHAGRGDFYSEGETLTSSLDLLLDELSRQREIIKAQAAYICALEDEFENGIPASVTARIAEYRRLADKVLVDA